MKRILIYYIFIVAFAFIEGCHSQKEIPALELVKCENINSGSHRIVDDEEHEITVENWHNYICEYRIADPEPPMATAMGHKRQAALLSGLARTLEYVKPVQ